MFNIVRKIFNKEPVGLEPKNLILLLYRGEVESVCRSLSTLLYEIEITGLLDPDAEACKATRDVDVCYHVVSCMSGIIRMHVCLALQEQLLERLLKVEGDRYVLDEKEVLELRDHEKRHLRKALTDWYKQMDIDWLRAEAQTHVFIASYRKSKCDNIFSTTLTDREDSFLSETNLNKFTTYKNCVVEHVTHPNFSVLQGLIEGFVAERIRESKKIMNGEISRREL